MDIYNTEKLGNIKKGIYKGKGNKIKIIYL